MQLKRCLTTAPEHANLTWKDYRDLEARLRAFSNRERSWPMLRSFIRCWRRLLIKYSCNLILYILWCCSVVILRERKVYLITTVQHFTLLIFNGFVPSIHERIFSSKSNPNKNRSQFSYLKFFTSNTPWSTYHLKPLNALFYVSENIRGFDDIF